MKDGYEMFGNQFMSKKEYDYNMDQMIISMSDDMDWARDHGLGVDNLEYLKTENKDLRRRKYDLSITKRHAVEYKIRWIKKDIGGLFRNTLVKYDVDAILGIHHWDKMKRLAYRGKRSAVTIGKGGHKDSNLG
uniref:Uncharacterized protein n=1 Tax=Tanacetum cinerariifolium TaxID=118510 RepID=A0A6L2J6V5_TANCI|nr:hypothetical protein [Tanacetum cinerariifolium]